MGQEVTNYTKVAYTLHASNLHALFNLLMRMIIKVSPLFF